MLMGESWISRCINLLSSPPPDGERRQVAILFADLAGYTQLSRTLDAEEIHALLGQFFAFVDGKVKAYGGTIDKHIGDCVMAVFGTPVARGNDAEHAVARPWQIKMSSRLSAMSWLARSGSHRHRQRAGGGEQHRERCSSRVHGYRRCHEPGFATDWRGAGGNFSDLRCDQE